MNTEQPLTHLMHKSIWLMDRYADQLLTTHFSISFNRFYVLAILGTVEPTTQHALAECLNYSDAAVSRMITHLQEENLVTQTADPHHGRKNVITLTNAGRTLLTKCNQLLEGVFDDLLKATNIDREHLRKDMETIVTSLEQLN